MTILVIEDEASDALLLCRGMRQAACAPVVSVVNSANDAVKYLTGEGEWADRNMFPLPSLIVLDLTLPGMSGLDFLSWIHGQPSLTRIPVVVLSGSPYGPDVSQAYQRGAKTFFIKPEGRLIDKLAQSIVLYWSASLTPGGGPIMGDGSGSQPAPPG